MSYQDTITRLRDKTRADALAALDRHDEGLIDDDQLARLLLAILVVAGARAATVGDMAFAGELTRLNNKVATPLGLRDFRASLYPEAVATVLEGGDRNMRVARLAHNAPLQAAQTAFGKAMAAAPVDGWTRQLSPDACQLCRWWHRDGKVWPKDHPMPTHTGCDCTQRPIRKEQ